MSYDSEVLADSPIARYRLNDAAPVGAGSVVDSVASYEGTPNGAITWGQAGCLSDGTSNSARFNGTSGYVTLGSSLATDLMGAAAWTVELWFYGPAAATGVASTHTGTLFAAASDATHRVHIQYSNASIFTSSDVGGSKSTNSGRIGSWHHLVLTSAGSLYIDGVEHTNTSGAGLNSTVQATIGALNNATGFFGGRVSEVALYTTALSQARVVAHYTAAVARTITPGRTFYHDFEQDLPAVFPVGSDDTGQYDQTSSRSTAQAYAGSYSLSMGGGTFRSMTFDNPTDQNVWASGTEGKVKLRFRVATGTAPGMLFQLSGKSRHLSPAPAYDNYSIKLLYSASTPFVSVVSVAGTATVVTHSGGALSADTWHEAILRWRSTAHSPNVSLTINGVETTGTSANIGNFGAMGSWHHLLIGNDTSTNPTGFWIDEFETFGSWDGSAVDETVPTLDAAEIDATGTVLTLAFSEAVTGVSAADFTLSTGQTLSAATGSGTEWDLTISPAVMAGATPTLAYTGTAIVDAASNALATSSGAAITNGSTLAAPAITSASTKSGQVGVSLSYTITATGTAPITYGASGLPDGLMVDPDTGVISGTPTTAAVTAVTVSATNGVDTDTLTVTFTIAEAEEEPDPGPTPQNLSLFNQLAVAVGAEGGHQYNLDALNAISQQLTGSAGHTLNIDALNAIAGFYIGSEQAFTLNIDAINAITGDLGGASDNTRTTEALAGWRGRL